MFSRRVPDPGRPNALSVRLEALRARGVPLLDLTESNPVRAGLGLPPERVLAPLGTAASLAYEPDPRGVLTAREAVARYYSEAHATIVDPARVTLTASTSEAYGYVFKLLCDPGDEVLVPRPSYPLFDLLASLESLNARSYPLGYDGAWHLDAGEIARALSPRTRAVLLVSPNNPTGSFTRQRELDALVALCAERGIALVSDEVFADYAYGPDPSRAPTLARESRMLCFTLSGLSKVCALPQMKLGWIVCTGPDDVRGEAQARLEIIADSYLSPGAPAQNAAPAWLAARDEAQRSVMDRVRNNRDFALRTLRGDTSCACGALASEGGWYLVLRVPATRTEDEWVLALAEQYGVIVQPGYFFEFDRGAHLVLSLLPREPDFREGFARVLECVRGGA